jgi:hypothetical protein
MILFTNGCSWTYGGSLGLDLPEQSEERLTKVWPHHLGNLLNATQVINLAVGCGSNQRTFRTTHDWVTSSSADTLSDTLAIIQFTEPSRYEYNLPANGHDLEESWVKCKAGVVTSDIWRPDLNELHQEINDKRLCFYSDIEGAYSVLAYCEALHNLFTRHGVKYYFWDGGFLFFLLEENLIDKKLKDYFLEKFNWFPLRIPYEPIAAHDVHPSIQGHKDIANNLHQILAKTILAYS